MDFLKHVQTLMGELGPLLDGIETIDQEGDDHWMISFDDSFIAIDFEAPARKLVFWTNLGQPEPESQAKIHETLLSYNYLWSETGGIRMATEEPGGNVVMVFDLFVLDLDITTLSTVVVNFLEKTTYWRHLIAAGFEETASSNDSTDPTTSDPQADSSAIRV